MHCDLRRAELALDRRLHGVGKAMRFVDWMAFDPADSVANAGRFSPAAFPPAKRNLKSDHPPKPTTTGDETFPGVPASP